MSLSLCWSSLTNNLIPYSSSCLGLWWALHTRWIRECLVNCWHDLRSKTSSSTFACTKNLEQASRISRQSRYIYILTLWDQILGTQANRSELCRVDKWCFNGTAEKLRVCNPRPQFIPYICQHLTWEGNSPCLCNQKFTCILTSQTETDFLFNTAPNHFQRLEQAVQVSAKKTNSQNLAQQHDYLQRPTPRFFTDRQIARACVYVHRCI